MVYFIKCFRKIYWANIYSCAIINITIDHFTKSVDGVTTARTFFTNINNIRELKRLSNAFIVHESRIHRKSYMRKLKCIRDSFNIYRKRIIVFVYKFARL